MNLLTKKRAILPGLGLSLGLSVLGLSLMVFIPIVVMVFTAFEGGWDRFVDAVTDRRVLAAAWFSLRMSFYATLINLVFGSLVAWVLVRYRFLGRSLLNALVDLPFALPTAVTGVTLASLYAPTGLIGQMFAADGIFGRIFGPTMIAFDAKGVVIALIVVTLPFMVRAVQPVLETLNHELEEAATVLGATRGQTVRRVILPELVPAMIMGCGMMFARATGEYGSVIFIANNIPYDTEILPLVITGKLDQFNPQAASAVALLMLMISAVILLAVNIAQWRFQKRLVEAH